jgi:hypothetical protein
VYVIDRHVLFRHVEQDELDLEADRLLPPTVILLARPSTEELTTEEPDAILLRYWRRLFHANLHIRIDKLWSEGKITPEELARRIEQIGRSEFDEVRTVLGQEKYLFPAADERAVYSEFAAVYLELRYFAANLLPAYFPAIGDAALVEQILAKDLDAGALFARTRPAGVPDPVVRTDDSADESNDYFWRLLHGAERAARSGNTVRAAILRTRAARVAPASRTAGTRAEAEADLRRLTARLQAALHLSGAEAAEWLRDLPALLDKADQGNRPVEAALLYDLQKVCVDHERDVYTLDLIEWLRSAGNRPIKRPLPSQRLVRVTKHLRSAAQRLTMARLSDADRQHFAGLLQTALNQSEESVRLRFRPVLTDAVQDVGLLPANPPECTAFLKMIEELLDRITEVGFVTFSDLRDAVSRNQLKLPDLGDPQEFVRGDPLLRLDRRLATLLDGVYHPSEFYLRWLERFTALNFGTTTGRIITRHVTLPFGGALVILEGLQKLLEQAGVSLPALSPLSTLFPSQDGSHWPVLGILAFLVLGSFLWSLLHVPAVRRTCQQAGRWTYRGVRLVLLDAPTWFFAMPAVQLVWKSWPFQLFSLYLFKPLLATAVVYGFVPDQLHTYLLAIGVFVAANFLLNSRLGRSATDGVIQAFVEFFNLLRAGLVPGLFRLAARLFKQILEAVEYVLFSVEEWLRFRSGDSRFLMVVRTILGFFWFPIAYVTRFYIVVLIEPGFNPIKAPVSYLAAKLMWPLVMPITQGLAHPLEPVLGRVLAYAVVVPTVWLLPDAVGFLVWEMKENWSLYRANRRATLRPVVVGAHGETVRRLLQPGFHSGTVPKLYARLRQAEREAVRTGNWRAARSYRRGLQEVERSLRLLVTREWVTLLQQTPGWQGQRLGVGRVILASNRIAVELVHADFLPDPVRVEWEERSGWLIAGIQQPGWLGRLTAEQRPGMTAALAGLYKLAGIDLVREQVGAQLPAAAADGFDVSSRGLVIRPPSRQGRALLYDLGDPKDQIRPRTLAGAPTANGPVLEAASVVFARVAIPWDQWVAFWQGREKRPALPWFQCLAVLLPVDKPAESGAELPPVIAVEKDGKHNPERRAAPNLTNLPKPHWP